MLYYGKIDLSERIDLTKSTDNKECVVCHYWFFNNGFKFRNSVCKGYHDLTMFCLNLSDIVISTIKGVDYRRIIHGINKSEAIH